MLPYTTVVEAEASLGRSLTVAESIWLSYTAEKSDFFLYTLNIIFLVIIISVFPSYYLVLEYFFKNTIESFKIQPKVRNSFSDYLSCYKNVMRIYLLVVGPIQIVSYPIMKMLGIRTSLPLPSLWEIAVQLVVYLIIEDYSSYWLHRLLHSKWGYDNIHKVHHEYTAPIGFAAPYAHWAEFLILGMPSFLGPAIVPGHTITLWLWIALRQAEAIEIHSGYDFPWSLARYVPFYGGPEYHDYHHYVGRQSQSNFASIFTYCDRIYGTDKGYRYQKKLLQQSRDGLESNGVKNANSLDQSTAQAFKLD